MESFKILGSLINFRVETYKMSNDTSGKTKSEGNIVCWKSRSCKLGLNGASQPKWTQRIYLTSLNTAWQSLSNMLRSSNKVIQNSYSIYRTFKFGGHIIKILAASNGSLDFFCKHKTVLEGLPFHILGISRCFRFPNIGIF